MFLGTNIYKNKAVFSEWLNCNTIYSRERPAHFYGNEPVSKYFSLVVQTVATTEHRCYDTKAAIDDMQMSGCGQWNLLMKTKFKFRIIFTHEIIC